MDQVNQEEVNINPKSRDFVFAVEDIDLAFDTIDAEMGYNPGAVVAQREIKQSQYDKTAGKQND